ncbi:hypothetical protein CsatB_017140 [Cannabis sativa]
MPKDLNATNLVLIPKKKTPVVMGDLRPIALCNVLYKVISKVLANRLKGLLSKVISELQSAFILGRLISDNVLVSFEILHYLRRKQQGKHGCMALKLDMSKAYDRMEWSFLHSILLRMGFSTGWVSMIMKCLHTISYNIVHGGEVLGPIVPTRGIRQGDPISPYLFIICAEGLSALIRLYEEKKWIHGCRVARRARYVTHMLFADDSFLYCSATMDEAHRVLELLHKFEEASGQKVNLNKSSVFFSSNTLDSVRSGILSTLHMHAADENSFYLGLPSMVGRNKNAAFGFLKENVRKRIQNWDSKLLSIAGKEVLLNKDIDRLMGRFWWHSKASQGGGIHWKSWDKLCLHKHKGGLGFRNLRDFNLSMLGANPSYAWRSLFEAQDVVKMGARWRVGSGALISVLHQPWLPSEDNPYVISSHEALQSCSVSNLLQPGRMCWDMELLEDLFDSRDVELIFKIPMPALPETDTCIGRLKNLVAIRWNAQDNSGFWRKFWYLKLPPKVKNLLWRALTDCLPTLVSLQTKRVHVYSVCSLCNFEPETTFHLMVGCSFTKACVERGLGLVINNGEEDFGAWFEAFCISHLTDNIEKLAMILWSVWGARNDLVWNDKAISVERVVSSAITYLDLWKSAQNSNGGASSFSSQFRAGVEHWIKPSLGELKVNCDAALFSGERSHGLGWIARDHAGLCVSAAAVKHRGDIDPVVAEALSMKEALSWIKSCWEDSRTVEGLCPTAVLLESDCLVLVNAITSKSHILSPLGLIVLDCISLIRSFSSFDISVQFVKRSGNQAANWLARSSGSCPDRISSRGSVPSGLEAILLADLLY